MQDSGEISYEKWGKIFVAHFLEIWVSMGAGEEKCKHMISGPGRLIAYVETLRETGFYNQGSEGWEWLDFLSINFSEYKNQKIITAEGYPKNNWV